MECGPGTRRGWCWQGVSRWKGWINSASSLRNVCAGDMCRALRGHNHPPGLGVLLPTARFCSSDLQPVCLCSTFVHNHLGQFPSWVVDYCLGTPYPTGKMKSSPGALPNRGGQEVHDHCWVCPSLPPPSSLAAALRQRCWWFGNGEDLGICGVCKNGVLEDLGLVSRW